MEPSNLSVITDKIIEILDTEYERMYPYELEKSLCELAKQVKDNDTLLQKIRWELNLLNCTFSHVVEHNGKTTKEIGNKWSYYLESEDFKPLSNLPFCEWHKEAVDYYEQRYLEAINELSKARYAFAIMTFSKGKDRLDWMKKSVEGWLRTAEKYIKDDKYSEFYEVPPFAYEFALKLSLSFGEKNLARSILESLHLSILKILDKGEKRWYLEFLEVESKYTGRFDNAKDIINESVQKIKGVISCLEKSFQESEDRQKSNHFLRHHLAILIKYKIENEYMLYKKIADSYISEAESRNEPLARSSFYQDAIKEYKLMQSKFSDKKDEINKKIEDLTFLIKDNDVKINYTTVMTEIAIKADLIDPFIQKLKQKDGIFEDILTDLPFIPDCQTIKKQTEDQKQLCPLKFIAAVVVSDKEEPIMKHTSEESIFDHYFRKNILFGIKISEVLVQKIFEKLETELKLDTFEEVNKLLKFNELTDIYPTLEKGFYYILGKDKDYIAGLHIVMPYIEEIIRRILKKAGRVDVILQSHNEKYFRSIELGTLVSDEEVGKLIGINFQKSLKVLLTDSDQINLRNLLLHGRLETEAIKTGEVMFVAYCLLKLIKMLRDK